MLRVVFINLILLLVVAIAAEAALFWLVSRPAPTGVRFADGAARKIYWRDVNYIQFQPSCAQYDPDLFYILRPGRCMFSNSGFKTSVSVNDAGLRDDRASLVAPNVIVLGDSQAMGWGVGGEETFAEQIEAKTGLRTLNAAVSSYGTAREVLLLNRLDRSGLDVLVVQFSDNDNGENRAYLNSGRRLPVRSNDEYLEILTVEKNIRYVPFKYLATFGAVIRDRLFPRAEEPRDVAAAVPTGPTMSWEDAFLQVLADAAVEERRPLLVLLELSLNGRRGGFAENVAASPNLEALKSKFSSVSVLDSTSLLSDEDYLFPDGHLTAGGHRKIADAIVNIIEAAGISVAAN